MPGHFLLSTFGSFGDLHPYIAVGRGLRNRGHRVTIATSENYRAKVEGEGLQFHPVRPDLSPLINRPEMIARAFHPRTGSEFIIRKLFLPYIEQSYEDLIRIAPEADLLVGHVISYAVPTVADVLRKRWISIALQPSTLISVFDPPVISGVPLARQMRALGPGFWRQWLKFIRKIARRWGEPVNRLREKLGLKPLENPLLNDMWSPWGTHAWFSRVLAEPQPDWPARTAITGFPFYDRLEPGQDLSCELRQFLDTGAPPVVFTLGSSAVFTAGSFYEESAEAARQLGIRAVLLVGRNESSGLRGVLAPTIAISEYAPYSELFPRAAAIVHQGGIGTTAQALRSGRPMVVVPFSHDQPDNAARVEQLGVARVLKRNRYRARSIARELDAILGSDRYRRSAESVAQLIAEEDGVGAACDALEAALRE